MSAKRTNRSAPPKILTMWDGPKYFDATFTFRERDDLRDKLRDACDMNGLSGPTEFEREIERPVERKLWPIANTFGITEYNDDRFQDWVLIQIAKDLEVDYKNFAQNIPKLPIDGFIKEAKQVFPEFARPKNLIQKKIQLRKLRILFADWKNEECARTGCKHERHWLCHDRYVDRDEEAILGQIADANEKRRAMRKSMKSIDPDTLGKVAKRKQMLRPKFEPLRLVHSA